MEYLTEDFEKVIVEWLRSDDENVTNLAHSLSRLYESKALNMHIVSDTQMMSCGTTTKKEGYYMDENGNKYYR